MKKQIVIMIGLTTLLAVPTRASQEKLAESIRGVQLEALRTAEQLKSTLGTLNALTKQSKGDLRPAYDAFGADVVKTEAAAGTTRKQVQWMAGEGRSYFQDWQTSVSGIANESLRKKAQKRLNSVKESYADVEQALQQASEKFNPFLSDLDDVRKALATDLTAGGVKSIRSTVKKANWDHQYVTEAVNSALKGMDKMQKALSSEAK